MALPDEVDGESDDETPTNPGELTSPPAFSGMSGLAGHLALDPIEADCDPLLGHDVGGAKLVRLIAEGGMGCVYEGLQAQPRRPVAVKVMRLGFVPKEACRRFDHDTLPNSLMSTGTGSGQDG